MTGIRIPKDWHEVELSDLANVNPEQLQNSTSGEYKFWYIDLSMVNNGKIDSPEAKINFSDSPSRARRIVRMGDVLMSTVRPNLCGHAQIGKEIADWICSTGFAVLRPKIKSDQSYIFHYLFSNHIKSQIN